MCNSGFSIAVGRRLPRAKRCHGRLRLALRTYLIFAVSLTSNEGSAQQVGTQPGRATPAIAETIVVTGMRPSGNEIAFETRHGLSEEDVEIIDAVALDELARRAPSVHVPTNSRGESIVFLRNAAERQVAIFYEGAAINVPWDNRLDLSLFPAGLIGSLRTASGPLAPHYGVNALGAMSISPRDATDAAEAEFMVGEENLWNLRGLFATPIGDDGAVALGASYASEDGQPLSNKAVLPFSQTDPDVRTNTDRELVSYFARARTDLGGHRLSVTALHVDGEKGIAPEGDRSSGARFWRYPEVRHSLGVASLESPLGSSTTLSSSLWAQHFEQTIDAYTNATYSTVSAREVNRDKTIGIRELATHERGPWRLVGSFNYAESNHDQQDITFAGGTPPAVLPPVYEYRQRNWSVGAEAEYRISEPLVAELGVGYDSVDYVETGDKPPIHDSGGWTGRSALIWSVGHEWVVRAAVGRKVRAPTMRELFGQAVNRFLINPDLEPERIVTTELAVERRTGLGGFFVIPFYQSVDGTIDQRNVGPLRQRINLVGSQVAGIEVGGQWSFGEWKLSGDATYAPARRRGTAPGQTDRLAEKPDVLASLRLGYVPKTGFNAAIELEYVGEAYSSNAAGRLVPLEQSTSLNLRAGYRLELSAGAVDLFVHADNLTDALIEPQIGLPAPGRWIRGGFGLAW